MTVQIGSSSRGGSGSGPVFFSDSFLRPDEPFNMGNDWFDKQTSLGNQAEAGIDANVNLSVAGGLVFGNGGGPVVPRSLFFPVPVDNYAIRLLSQGGGLFSQMKSRSRVAGVSCDAGLTVFADANRSNCYLLNFASATNLVTLYRDIGVLTALSAATAFSLGDMFRLECIPAVGSNTVRYYRNGGLVASISDATGGRPTVGLYGIGFFGSNTGQLGFQDFSGGPL